MADGNVYSMESSMKKKRSTKTLICSQLFSALVFAIGVTGGLLIGIYAYHGDEAPCVSIPPPEVKTTPCPNNKASQGATTPSPGGEETEECPNQNPRLPGRYEDQLFAPLTAHEMQQAADHLMQQKIISTMETPTSLTDNFIMYSYLHPPDKTYALSYLDNDGSSPDRHALVHVQRGQELDVMKYKVGPLGYGKTPHVTPITQPGDIHFNSRPYEMIEMQLMTDIVGRDMEILQPLFRESFDGAEYPRDVYVEYYNGPPGIDGNTRETRFTTALKGFRTEDDFDLLHMLPVSGSVHNPGTNSSGWYSYDLYYLNQGPFTSAAELMADYNANTLRKVKVEEGYLKTLWKRLFPQRNTDLPLRSKADIPGPQTYLPGGPRYTVKGSKVDWMGWEFEICAGQVRGPSLFNIKYKGERIVYELAVNDIALVYAMDSSGSNNIVYMDATYGIMGALNPTEIMLGVDCPEHGTTLEVTLWDTIQQRPVTKKAFCVFEADGQEPLWRHAGNSFQGGQRNRYLVVRAPVTIGNYDYTFDFQFFLDGKIFNYAKAAGYIQSSFWDAENPHSNPNRKTRDAFGYRVSDYQTGPIHDHMFSYKVDMDIVDRNNSFEIIKWKQGPALEALQTQVPNITTVPPYFIYNETRYVEWEIQQKEIGIRHTPEQQFWLMTNERNKNKWGVERSYQIVPLGTNSESLTSAHPTYKTASFSRYHCAVTKRKEDEQTSTSIYDANRMNEPKGYLDKQINNETIVDEDLVVWVSVGFLHVPTTEDVPMTVRVQTGFLLRPFNFMERTDTFDMPQYTETRDRTLTESEPPVGQCKPPKVQKYCRFC